MLLHARAEFDLSYPDLKNLCTHELPLALLSKCASSGQMNDELVGIGSEHRGGGDYYEEYRRANILTRMMAETCFVHQMACTVCGSDESSGSYDQDYQNFQDYLSDGQYSNLSYSDDERFGNVRRA